MTFDRKREPTKRSKYRPIEIAEDLSKDYDEERGPGEDERSETPSPGGFHTKRVKQERESLAQALGLQNHRDDDGKA